MQQECAEFLKITDVSRHIDATLGLGGHARYFFEKKSNLKMIGIDQDPYAQEIAKKVLFPWANQLEIFSSNFENIGELSSFAPQSILFDIGVSSLQFDMAERGFSFRFEAPLDMRMDPKSSLTAEIIVNTFSEQDLYSILKDYGEEPDAKRITSAIVQQRKINSFSTTFELAECIVRAKPYFRERNKNSGGHPAVLSFQALRIAVNRELEVLEKALHQAIQILEPKGRIAVLSFHSLEDRIVKQVFSSYFQKEKKQKYENSSILKTPSSGVFLFPIFKKPIIARAEEIAFNPRARSAKLRVVEKI